MKNFHTKLRLWHLENGRHLPWTGINDPYLIWISEIILQQTRVEHGISYYLKFIKAFPTVKHLAEADDDIILKMETGTDMRKAIKGYNVDFLNTILAMFSAIIIMTYIMYCTSPRTVEGLHTHHLYYTGIFVIAGLMRYLQITLVQNKAGSPTEILYKDRFIQVTLVLWIAAFYTLLYLKTKSIFN